MLWLCEVYDACAGAQELQKQQAAYRGLLQRNREQPLHLMQAIQNAAKPTALPLPFVLIQVSLEASALPGSGSRCAYACRHPGIGMQAYLLDELQLCSRWLDRTMAALYSQHLQHLS